MEVMPIDLTAIVAVVFGCLIVLIPLAGITARFTVKPIAEALARAREAQGATREVEMLEKRIALLEQQFGAIETNVERLVEEREFDKKLTEATSRSKTSLPADS